MALGLRGFLRHPGSDFASGRDGGLDEFAPLAAFGFALVSFALFYGAYKLDELKQYGNTPAAS